MYKILGSDQKEYGPVSAQQIIQWIKEGRANGSTMARAEGTENWLPLSQIPEFASFFAAGATGAAPSPTPPPVPHSFSGTADTDALANSVLARGGTISAGNCISRGWDLVMRHFWLMVGASFVVGLIEGALPILTGVCRGGLFILTLKLIRNERAEFADAFAGFADNFLQLFLVGLVVMLLVTVGLGFCVIPGIYLGVAWAMAIPLVADKKMEFWPAMELSRKVINKHWWDMFWLLVLGILITLVGCCACCVGVYVAIPVFAAAWAYAYEDIFSSAPATTAQPR